MAYTKTTWIDNAEPAITASRLNKLEEGIQSGHTIAEGKPSTADVAALINNESASIISEVDDNISTAITNLRNEVDPQLASINQDISNTQTLIPTDEDIVDTMSSAVTSGAYGFTTLVENTALAAVDNSGQWALSSDVSTIQANYKNASEINAIADTRISTAIIDGTVASTNYVQSYVSTAITETALDTQAVQAIAETAITTAVNEGDLVASAQAVSDLQSDVAANTSAISTTNTTLTSLSSAYSQTTSELQSNYSTLAQGQSDLESDLTSTQSTISSNYTTLANAQSSLASSVSSLSSSVGNNTTSISTIEATYATNNSVDAMKQVAVNSNGNITGWTASNGTSGSSFLIQADNFSITDQTRSATPFSLDTTTGQAVFNGKVSFTNVTDTDNLVTSNELTTAINDGLPSDIVTESGFRESFNQNVTTIDGGKITTGRIQNSLATSYVDLNATGTSAFMKVNDSVRINADGSGTFARSLVTEPNIVASGIKTGLSLGNSFTYYIDTGVSVSSGWATASTDQYACTATISGGYSSNGGGTGYMDATIVIGDGLFTNAAYNNPIDNRIYIKCVYSKISGNSITTTKISWKLVKL